MSLVARDVRSAHGSVARDLLLGFSSLELFRIEGSGSSRVQWCRLSGVVV